MTAVSVKTLQYLSGSGSQNPRLIVAVKYLKDGRVTFIDRNNSLLLITNPNDESLQEVDLIESLVEQEIHDRNMPSLSQDVKPSDVNNGFNDDQLLITYTGKDFSLAVVYQIRFENNEAVLQQVFMVKVSDRTRSVVVLDTEHMCATTPNQIVVLNKSGERPAFHERVKCERGGFSMSDGKGRVFYDDGHTFVCCHWNGRSLTELFRFVHLNMKSPRGSAIDGSGWVVVCCDSSHNIFRISSDGKQAEIIVSDEKKSFGDVDFHPKGGQFITTFWEENEWPVLFKLGA